ncbi:13590_t:CDS:2 [Funneliformis geosporum]|nr:13590_t:CDS:2 [Funneliformis geosporum]
MIARISSKWSKILRKESFIRDGWTRGIQPVKKIILDFSGARQEYPDTARQEEYPDPAATAVLDALSNFFPLNPTIHWEY